MQNLNELSQNFDEEDSDTNSVLEDRYLLRIQTAPARPFTDLEEFKRQAQIYEKTNLQRSQEFILLEQAFVCQQHLVQKDFQKYDLDSPEGVKICKKYLNIIEKICEAYDVKVASRCYRNEFSKAYKILYKEDKLCYLTEILDSAQEGFPYLWVNGEKYTFSMDVLDAGSKLIEAFYRVQHILRHAYGRTCQETPELSSKLLKLEIQTVLEEFDTVWVLFEQSYVKELMHIESKARRYISQGIELEKELASIEIREKLKGKILVFGDEYIHIKKQLCKVMAQINAVANIEGKGRDDLQHEILFEAEGLIRRISKEQSKAVRILADQIKRTFQRFRDLMKKYEENIEMVDPQLKNNQDLVEVLQDYEVQWEKGLNYFLDSKKCTQLIFFSHIIETTGEKHKSFQEQIEYRDSEIFVSIPCLMVLKHLENEDRNICQYFLPIMNDPTTKQHALFNLLKSEFQEWRQGHAEFYEYYNILEKMLLCLKLEPLELETTKSFSGRLDSIMQKIKLLSIELQRYNAQEWNQFIDAAINTE